MVPESSLGEMSVPNKRDITKTKIVCFEKIIQSNNHTITHSNRKYIAMHSINTAEYAAQKKIDFEQIDITGIN